METWNILFLSLKNCYSLRSSSLKKHRQYSEQVSIFTSNRNRETKANLIAFPGCQIIYHNICATNTPVSLSSHLLAPHPAPTQWQSHQIPDWSWWLFLITKGVQLFSCNTKTSINHMPFWTCVILKFRVLRLAPFKHKFLFLELAFQKINLIIQESTAFKLADACKIWSCVL